MKFTLQWVTEDICGIVPTTHRRRTPSIGTGTGLMATLLLASAFEEAFDQEFNIKEGDNLVSQTLRDAYKDLQQSKDPAVQYYMSTLTDLPKGSQPRNPEAVPEVDWFDKSHTIGSVETPAGTHLGFIEKHSDGRWGISPSEDGSPGITAIAKASADAKTYLVNRLTKQVTVTVNGEQRQLRIVRDRDFFPLPERTAEITLHSDI